VTLPERILSFWNALLGLHERVHTTSWGAVVTDSRYPLVHEANHATVLRAAPGLTVADIRSELLPALERVRAMDEHIEFMDADDDSPALRDLLTSPGAHDPDVVMAYEGDRSAFTREGLADMPEGVEVREVERTEEPFWALLRDVPNQYGDRLPDEVLDQMLERVEQLFVPAGERFFLGTVNGTDAGMASVLTLEGVAYLDNVVTWPEFRRRGVATATVSTALRTSLEGDAELVFLLAEQGGAAQGLYERLGFQVRRRCFGFTRLVKGRHLSDDD
jgi:ribosomal protein S18 acetylase RimI-like enzyme